MINVFFTLLIIFFCFSVFKKTAPNGKLTVYVERRELIIEDTWIQPLTGVLYIDPNYVKDRKVYGQFVLTFRYGREDEEVRMKYFFIFPITFS